MDRMNATQSTQDCSLPKTVVSIVNWNGTENTATCLSAFSSLTYDNLSIIVVDNASMDRSIENITNDFPSVELIRSDSNLGFAGGHRLALERVLDDPEVELFWMLNNDAFVEPDTLAEIVKAYALLGPAVYGSVPLHTDTDEIESLLGWEVYEGRDRSTGRRLSDLIGQTIGSAFPGGQPLRVTSIHGCSFVVPTSIIRRYGFMDESYFLYGEEVDYCLRLTKVGVTSILVPKSVVRHIHRASTKKADNEALTFVVVYYTTRNGLRLSLRHYGTAVFLRAVFKHVTWVAGGVIRYAFSRRYRTMERRHRLYFHFLGIRDMFFGRFGRTIDPGEYL